MKYFLLSDNTDTLTGMRLAGIEGKHVSADDIRGIKEALSTCMCNPEIGIVLITEKLSALCPELIYELKLKSKGTLVVEIPDRHGTRRAPDSITRYIREAIGVKL